MSLVLRLVLCACLVGLTPGMAAAQEATVDNTIDEGESPADAAATFIGSVGELTLTMMESEMSGQERAAIFANMLVEHFALDRIARFTLGRHARAASDEQLSAFSDVFTRMIYATYRDRFERFDGETLQVLGASPVGGNLPDLVVSTQVIEPGNPTPIGVDFRVRELEGVLRIIDVSVEGVSQGLTQRDEFNSIIQSNGLDGLIDRLQQRYGTVEVPGL